MNRPGYRLRLGLAALPAVLLLLTALPGHSITTAELANPLSCRDCLNWRATGVCFWLKCSLSGCKVKTSLKVAHNNPDLVIQAYNGAPPWDAAAVYAFAPDGTLAAAAGRSTANFKNCDAIGHPGAAVLEGLAKTGYYCPSQTRAFTPYFLSARDGDYWHDNPIEQVLAIPNLLKRVGNLGPLYPRTGWSTQADDVKAAALVAARAGHIVTRAGQPHLYYPLRGRCDRNRMRCWEPPALDVSDPATGAFQLLAPVTENRIQPMTGVDSAWVRGKYTAAQQYAWALWRPYECCKQRGAFLYAVEFE